MNEQEKNVYTNLFEYPTQKIVELYKEKEKLQERFDRLKQEHIEKIDRVNELRERIDKAIEYIENDSAFLNDNEWELFNKKDLLGILRGEDKE